MRNIVMNSLDAVVEKEAQADFFIHELVSLDFFGNKVYITTTHICTLIVLSVIAIIAVMGRNSVLKAKGTPSKFGVGVELAVSTLEKFTIGTMGKTGAKYTKYIGTIFVFIFFSNISGVFGLRPPTADYGTTLMLALVTFFMIQYANIRYNKFGAFTNLFKPIFLFFPINVISEFATPVSLSLRLFGNVLAGTVMLSLYYSLVPVLFRFGVPSALHIYFDLFSGAIQTYVFCMLTMVFISDKRGDGNK